MDYSYIYFVIKLCNAVACTVTSYSPTLYVYVKYLFHGSGQSLIVGTSCPASWVMWFLPLISLFKHDYFKNDLK